MRRIVSVSVTAAALTILALGTTGAASARMMDTSREGHGEDHGRNVEMGGMAKMDGMDKVDGMMEMCLDHADKIGLTEDQTSKMKPMHRDMQKKDARFRADLKIAEIELVEIMEVKDFDLEKASSAVRKISDIKTAHRLGVLKAAREMRALLTEEQFKKMRSMMSMKPEHKRQRKNMGK